jgi:ABC-type nitrate/sulfonate/bicarbonate transport system substrate-binding protein
MKTRYPILLALSMALALLVAGCATAQRPAELVKITAMRDWPALWPMQIWNDVAVEKGFYAEEGLEVTWEYPPTAPDIVKLVATQKAHFGLGNTIDAISTNIQGLELAIVGVAVPRDMGGVMYFADSGIKTPADLAGKTVGIYNWPQTNLHFQTMLTCNGLTLAEVNKVDAGDYSAPLMISGQVQAADTAVGGEDQDVQRETGREVLHWLYNEHCVPPFYTSMFFVNPQWAQENPEIVTKFIRASFKAIDYTDANIDEAVEIASENFPEADKDWLKNGWLNGVHPFLPPYPQDEGKTRGSVSTEIIQNYMDFLYEGGLIEKKIDPASFINLDYLP